MEQKTEKNLKDLVVVIRIAGGVKVKSDIKNTLERLRLRRKYSCILINSRNPSMSGMLEKVKFSVAFGNINKETLASLLKLRGKKIDKKKFNSDESAEQLIKGKNLEDLGFKPFFRLHPPRGGIKSKLQYPKGILGDNKENINKLVMRML